MTTSIGKDQDIWVNNAPIDLANKYPDLFSEYTSSINPDMGCLTSDPRFLTSVENKFGKNLSEVEIKINQDGTAVFVRRSNAPNDLFQSVAFGEKEAVLSVAKKTQEIWNRLDKMEGKSKRSLNANPYAPLPSPSSDSDAYAHRIKTLENQVAELKEQLAELRQNLQNPCNHGDRYVKASASKARQAKKNLKESEKKYNETLRELEQAKKELSTLKQNEIDICRDNNAHVDSLTKKISNLEERLGEHNKNAELLQSEISSLQQQNTDIKSNSKKKIQKLQEQLRLSELDKNTEALKSLTEEHNQLKSLLDQIRSSLEGNPQDLEEENQPNHHYEKLPENVKSTINSLKEQVKKLEQNNLNIDNLTSQYAEKEKENTSLKSEIEKLTQEKQSIQDKENQINELQEALKKEKEDQQVNLQNNATTITDLQQQLTKQSTTADDLQSKIRGLEQEKTKIEHDAKNRIEALQKELETLKNQTQKLGQDTEELNRLKATCLQFQGLLDQIRSSSSVESKPISLSDELKETSQTTQNYQQLPENVDYTINSLKEKIRELEQEKHTINGLNSQIDDLRSECASKQQENTSLKETIEQLKLENEHIKTTSQEDIQKKEDQIQQLQETLKRERGAQKTELQTSAERITELEASLNESEDARKSAHAINQQQQTVLDQKNAEIKDFESQISKLEDLQRQLQSMQNTIGDLTQERDSLKTENTNYSDEYDKLLNKNKTLKGECNQLRNALATTLAVSPDLSLEQFQQAANNRNEETAELKSTITLLTDEVAKYKKENQHLQKQHEEALKDLESAKKELAELSGLKNSLQEMERQLGFKKGQSGIKALEALRNEYFSLKKNEEAYKARIKILETTVRRLEDQLGESSKVQKPQSPMPQQEGNAIVAAEVLGEIAKGIDGSELKLEEIAPQDMILYLRSYLKEMNTGSLSKHHLSETTPRIEELNKKPYPLSDLTLFQDLFKVINLLAPLTTSDDFKRLKENNESLKTLSQERDQDQIKKIREENRTIIKGLLFEFFNKLNKEAGLSRFRNIGIAIWQWNHILSNLSRDFYEGEAFKKTYRGTNLENAEKTRREIGELHTQFQAMMRPFA